MEFFTPSDLEYFSSVIGKRFPKEDPELQDIGTLLKEEGVFAKTAYWTDLIKEEGFYTEFENHWQMSGQIRRYTWSRVYLDGFEDTQVYFTLGVGSSLTKKKELVTTLEYKLDCQRNKLSKSQINKFDEFLKSELGQYPWIKIEIDDLENYNWEILKGETLDFIEAHKDYYEACVNLIWPQGVGVAPKIARICWNTERWIQPSGPYGKSVSNSNAFEDEQGYGYEEWLFDTDKQIDGYHYGFIQAFNAKTHKGNIYDLHLYSIFKDPETKESKYYWIAHLPYAEVLTSEQREFAKNQYHKNGWLDEMLSDLENIGVNEFFTDPVDDELFFNVRFKVEPRHYEIYKPRIEIEDPVKELGKNRHYVLLDKPGDTIFDRSVLGSYKFREGHNPTKKGKIKAKTSKREHVKELKHEEIKESMYHYFFKIYKGSSVKVGTENGTGYGKEIDLVVHDPNGGDTFYEIKTGANGLSCIREALGQIIEYNFYPKAKNATKLVIVSPNKLNTNEQEYIAHLRNELKIELYYQRYNVGSKKLEADLY